MTIRHSDRGSAGVTLAAMFICPDCRGQLRSQPDSLQCRDCSSQFPLVNGIPRFVSSDNYAVGFGFQWRTHASTQIDSFSGTTISRDRFFLVTQWPSSLPGERILEAGCGAGRFTEIALSTGADVYSFDYSESVDANREINGDHPNLQLFQADIERIPLPSGTFDKAFCLGVLQHCPDPHRAFDALTQYLKPGGEIVIDVYHRKIRDLVNPAVWLRFVTRRMNHQRLYKMIRVVVPVLLPVKNFITERLPKGKYLAFFIPVVSHSALQRERQFTKERALDWSILDTFDNYAAYYDQPQTLKEVESWFRRAHLTDVAVQYGPNGINARGRRPLDTQNMQRENRGP